MWAGCVDDDDESVLLGEKSEKKLEEGWLDPYTGFPLAKAAASDLSMRACWSSRVKLSLVSL